MDHANPGRTGKTSYLGPVLAQLDWSRKVGGGPLGIACDRFGHVILGATFYEAWWSNELYAQAYDNTGEIVWRQKVKPYDWGGSQGVKSAPGLDKAGNVSMNSGYGQVVKFNRAGDQIVTMQARKDATNDSAPAVLREGSVVHYQFASLYKWKPDGTLLWQQGAISQTDPAVAPNGDIALGGVRTNEPHGSTDLTYHNSNGTVRWRLTSTRGLRTQPCFGPDGILYATRGGTTAYFPDGTVKWNQPNGGWGVCLDGLGRALVPSGTRVYAYNKDTGAPVWTATIPGVSGIVEGLTIDGQNRIYGCLADGFVFCLNSDGSLRWNIKLADQLLTQPSIGNDKSLYVTGKVGFNDYFLYRIK